MIKPPETIQVGQIYKYQQITILIVKVDNDKGAYRSMTFESEKHYRFIDDKIEGFVGCVNSGNFILVKDD